MEFGELLSEKKDRSRVFAGRDVDKDDDQVLEPRNILIEYRSINVAS